MKRPVMRPVDKSRWNDLIELLGEKGGWGGCWCMLYRLSSNQFWKNGNAGNRAAMAALLDRGEIPGLLAYIDGRPVGWISVAPREQYGRLMRSTVNKPIDDQPVWSIVCMFIDRNFRREGLSLALIEGAVKYVRRKRGKIVEAYPFDETVIHLPPSRAFIGVASAFRKLGFKEVGRHQKHRPVMRYYIENRPPSPNELKVT